MVPLTSGEIGQMSVTGVENLANVSQYVSFPGRFNFRAEMFDRKCGDIIVSIPMLVLVSD